jgi:hypothetical protein
MGLFQTREDAQSQILPLETAFEYSGQSVTHRMKSSSYNRGEKCLREPWYSKRRSQMNANRYYFPT